MYWSVPLPGPMENDQDPESMGQASAALDPLLFQGDSAIDLISRCEMLLEERRAELHWQTEHLDGPMWPSPRVAKRRRFSKRMFPAVGVALQPF